MNKIAHASIVAAAVVVGAAGAVLVGHRDGSVAVSPSPTPTAMASATPSPASVTLAKVTNDAVNRVNVITGSVTNNDATAENVLVTVTFLKAGKDVYAASTVLTAVAPRSTQNFSFSSSDLYTDYDSTSAVASVVK